MGIGRFAKRAGVTMLVLAATDQLLDHFLLYDGTFLGRPVAPFDPPLFSPSQREVLLQIEEQLREPDRGAERKFDVDLGWCNRPGTGFGDFRYDWAGARIGQGPLPRQKTAGIRRAVALGCSMTHGEEVGPDVTWCAKVDAELDGLEVANLGVAAYGIDQALLRLRRDAWKLEPDEVWLGVLPRAALRVTTLFRPLLDHWSLDVAFKPRFVLDDQGELSLVPNPAQSLTDIPRLLHDQRSMLDALRGMDPWVSRAPIAYAPSGSSWLHRFFTSRLLLTLWERGDRDIGACFREDCEFGRLFTAIVREMARDVAARGATFRLLILPGKDDLSDRIEDGRGFWNEWTRRRSAEGMWTLDLSEALLGSGRELDSLFAPHGHYNAEGTEIVAQALRSALQP